MILVVASHPGTRDILIALLVDKGYPAKPVDCGDDALAHLRFQPPKLVILDCDTPDAFDMLDRFRQEPRIARIPVLMYSESAADLRDKALAKGADAFVQKGSLDWDDIFAQTHSLIGPPE